MKKLALAFICIILLGSFKVKENPQLQIFNDNWQVRQLGTDKWLHATVPGNVHYDLLQAGLIPDPYYRDNENKVQWVENENWVYETSFDVDPDLFLLHNIYLVFDGLDTYASVVLNGDTVLNADNMFVQWKVDVKNSLHQKGNNLRICFTSLVQKLSSKRDALPYKLPSINDKTGICPLVRKAPYHFGWDWGPRLVTCGMWRPVYLRGWEDVRIDWLQVATDKISDNKAFITINTELTCDVPGEYKFLATAGYGGKRAEKLQTVRLQKGDQNIQLKLEINNPQLWYPVGYGSQPLYDVDVKIFSKNKIVSEKSTRTGLRTVELVQEKDRHGRSFYFKINGIPVFAKGANIIPLDNMLNLATRQRYEKMVDDALAANMNMLRTWGGGIYENNDLYEICDEKGLMLWQDFMFGNEMYSVDSAFYNSVKNEAVYNVKRLRNHPCIVLWCGDNEGEWTWKRGWNKRFDGRIWDDYRKITYQLLPEVVYGLDSTRPYWRSSPSSDSDSIDPNNPNYGDTHDWRVHFGPPPYEMFQTDTARFVSEFGQQSFADRRTIEAFTIESDRSTEFDTANFGQKMKSEVLGIHNKQSWGNNKIKAYMQYYYPVPTDFKQYVYVSQISQADGLRIGVEHFRRCMPVTMGALYWQLNDCWPVISWSTVDYYGRWKAAHYYARKFFAPILVSPVIDKGKIKISVISDKIDTQKMTLQVKLIDFEGQEYFSQLRNLEIKPLQGAVYLEIDSASLFNGLSPQIAFLDCRLLQNNREVCDNQLYFDKVKNLNLPRVNILSSVVKKRDHVEIKLSSEKLVKNLWLSNDSVDGHFSDNYFDLLPGKPVVVKFKSKKSVDVNTFKRDFSFMTMNDLLTK